MLLSRIGDRVHSVPWKGILMKRVKEVCLLAGISKRTLQFYDDSGVLPVKRSDVNERLYDVKDLHKLGRILVYKQAGLKLNEIKEILNLEEKELKEMLMHHIKNLEDISDRLTKQVGFTNYIIDNGMPDFSGIDDTDDHITYMKFIEQLVDQIV